MVVLSSALCLLSNLSIKLNLPDSNGFIIQTFISADIGGTNTRLRIFEIRSHDQTLLASPMTGNGQQVPGLLLLMKSYQNQDYASFGMVVTAFLAEAAVSKPPVTACLAVAGPVKNNVVRFTNRDSWEIDGDKIGEELRIKKVLLINDFVAAGYGVLTLNTDVECITLQRAEKQVNAPIACIGAGTGLGQCFLTPSGAHGESGDYRCFASEGGHAEFAPRNELEFGLLTHLKGKFQQQHRVSVERIVSGTGLANVYEYLSVSYPQKVDPAITKKLDAAGDMKGAVIAGNQQNELCKRTMDLFVTAYGAEAGVAGLKWLPFGGLYLCGGLTPKNIDLLKDPAGNFMTAFQDKGRVSGMLMTIPVYAVMVEDLGERGAHYMAYKEFCKEMYVPSNSSSKTSYTYTSDATLVGTQRPSASAKTHDKERERNGSVSHPKPRSKSISERCDFVLQMNASTVTCLAVSVLSVCLVATLALRKR